MEPAEIRWNNNNKKKEKLDEHLIRLPKIDYKKTYIG